ncbi:MAG: A/G-specific adenine glycosylase [Anaerolineaceae bacterium]|nr:MAG: A/G-specific adenine glycosylase [Anaerolineaceae bacterium]
MTDVQSSLLLAWFDETRADLPWRLPSGSDARPDPYRVWLSEVMLQQTQIETVIPYYQRFLAAFPDVVALADAPLHDILKAWEGLGYYSRARNLHKTARIVAGEMGGQFPRTVDGLMRLPGIGRYTAGAIASIAFDQPAPVLDGNVIRVFSRLLDLPDDVTQTATKNRLWDYAAQNVPQKRAGDYNQALMELGQKVCTVRTPDCGACPLRGSCLAYARGTQAERPVKARRAAIPHYDVAAGIVYRADGRFLIAQRPPEGLLGGMWEFPGGKREAGETLPQTLQRELREELALEVEVGELFVVVRHAFTHFKITMSAFICQHVGAEPQAIEAQDFAWVTLADLDAYSFGKADRDVIAALHERGDLLL